ncbi:MAG TPA: prepilin peptidase [Candidatus Omnitrophota bacterium]|nr:prepilin peptidase [Candidatus Omnitrophota bacterium]HOD11630.1 prepilin peptidase [Candidatus Omnitrophota bacterium]
MDYLLTFFTFIFGTIIGSFLNVCIVRLPEEDPKKRSVVFPRSHCPSCKKTIPWYDNIPLVSFLLLGRKCRFCKTAISGRYFLVELVTGLAFVGFYKFFGLTPILIPYLVMLCGFIISTFVDIEHRIIPDEISIGGMVVGFIFSFFIPELHGTTSVWLSVGRSLLGILIGGGAIYAMGLIGDFIFKKESMGGGDVKFMAMVGAFLGWKLALLAFFIAPFFGAIFGIIVKIRTKESLIPYGPFLAVGSLIALFFSQKIFDWIFALYGIY